MVVLDDLDTNESESPAETLAGCTARLQLVRRQIERRHLDGTGTDDDAALSRSLDAVETLLASVLEQLASRH